MITLPPLLKSTLFIAFVINGLSACGGGGGGGSNGTDSGFTSSPTNTKPQTSVSATSISSLASSSTSLSSKAPTTGSSSSGRGPDLNAPTTPQNFEVGLKIYDAVGLNWVAATDNVAVVSYKIYRDNVQIGDAGEVDLSYLDFDVAPDRSYTYGIAAVDAVGNASAVKTVSVRTPPAPVYQGSSSSLSSTSISSSLGSSSISSQISNSSSSIISSQASSLTSSASSTASDTTPPQAPLNLATKTLLSTQVDLEWSPGSDNKAVIAYRIYRDNLLQSTVKATVLTYSDKNVAPNKSYIYAIESVDGAGNVSLTRKSLNVTTPSAATNGDVTLYWAAPVQREDDSSLTTADLGGFVIRYKLKSSSTFLSLYVTNGSATSYIIPSLVGDYEFQIAAYDKDNLFSKFVSISPH